MQKLHYHSPFHISPIFRQCLSICCARSSDAATRLGTTPVGLLPLSCSATGTGIRSRILALQLLTFACDKHSLTDHVPKAHLSGHQAVSEALATLRLRCAEPVRFRLLIGILNSGGGSGELQYVGLKFINTFMESAESLQTRLYLQAELSTAGLDPQQMSKLISPTSPWQAKLIDEVKRWEMIKIDVEKLQKDVRNAEHCRSKLVILERKVEMLQDEKHVFTSIERRLQEKCAELQREMMQLKKSQSASSTLEKRPVALPRQTIVGTNTLKKSSSENEDEGISSSETGQSSSPVPPHDYHSVSDKKKNKSNKYANTEDDDSNTTIDDVIEELTNIVNDAEREISEKSSAAASAGISVNIKSPLKKSNSGCSGMEKEIVMNLLPQPPKKASKSLVQIVGPQHEEDDYDLYYVDEPTPKEESPYENDYELELEQHNHPDIIINTTTHQSRRSDNNNNANDNNRQLLNVIMDAREREQQKINAAVNKMSRAHSLERDIVPQRQFSGGVFFMSNNMMNNHHHSRFSKPDIMTATSGKQQRSLGGSKNFASVDSMIDVVMSSQATTAVVGNSIDLKQTSKSRAIFLPTTAGGEKFSPSHNIAFNNFKFKNTNVNPSLFEQQSHGGKESRSQSNNGSKVTDLISGLY